MSLNPEQQCVVDHRSGPLRVCAVAGSGKTEATCRRIERLVLEGCPSERILAVTFSKKAANAMNDRLRRFGVFGASVSTWHAFALRVLRDDDTPWHNWEVEDGGARFRGFLKEVLGYKHLDWKGCDQTVVARYISACMAHVEEPGTPEAAQRARAHFYSARDRDFATKAYVKVQDLCDAAGLLTFDAMLMNATLWLRDEANRARWAAKFDHVLVDEAQDNSAAQHELWDRLSRDHGNVVLVGDARQAIYSWRGSLWKPFVDLVTSHAATSVDMVRNYRCASNILAAANAVIRLGDVSPCPDGIAEIAGEGRLEVCDAADVDEEAEEVAAWAQERVTEGEGRLSDMTVLFRVNAQSRALEDAFLRKRIPYRIIGGVNFYDRKSVKNLLAYLRAAFAPDSAEDVARSLNAPFRFLGKAFVDKVKSHWEDGLPMRAQLERVVQEERLQSRQVTSVNTYLTLIEALQRGFADDTPTSDRFKNVGDALVWLVDATKYADWIRKEEGEDGLDNSAISDARELTRVGAAFGTPMELLDYVTETTRAARKQASEDATVDMVTMMSIHRSKGLEFERVWVVGLNEGTLPHARGDEEEERRLCYVAMTRAKRELVLSYVHEMALPRGVMKVEPSRFLAEAGISVQHWKSGKPDQDEPPGCKEMPSVKDFALVKGMS